MILTLLAQSFLPILAWLAQWHTGTLPFNIDTYLATGVGYLRFGITFFPPFGTLLTAFLWYLGFILALKIIQLIPIIRNILN